MQKVRMISGLSGDLAAADGSCTCDTSAWRIAWGVASTASMAASVYHGYKRNDSVGWALLWGALGAFFPIITPTIAVAQGFGKRKR